MSDPGETSPSRKRTRSATSKTSNSHSLPRLLGVIAEEDVVEVDRLLPVGERGQIHGCSEEQRAPIDCVLSGRANVIVDAIPGAGKSASVLNLALTCPEKTVLQLTYNTMLAQEVDEKVQLHGIDNLTVSTYHALFVRYYDQCCFTDAGIRKIVELDCPPARPLLCPDILVLDETQDQTLTLLSAAAKYMRDAGRPFALAVFGDQAQALFRFRGADPRFLARADEIWAGHPFLQTPHFERFTFRTSYRLTHQMAWFVNNVLLGEQRITATRDGPPVSYVRRPARKMVPTIVAQIMSLIQKSGFSPESIFVIADSISSSPKIKEIVNQLVMQNIPVFAEFNERGERTNEAVLQGKVVFTTIHASKGRQRPVVIVAKFDNSSNRDQSIACPPTQFVETTRASTFLYIFESDYSSTRPFTFLQMNHESMAAVPEFIKFSGNPYEPPARPRLQLAGSQTQRFSPSALVRFVNDDSLRAITDILEQVTHIEDLPDDGPPLVFSSTSTTADGGCEDVSDLNGVALPAMFYDQLYREHRSEEANDTYCTLKHEIAMRVGDLTAAARAFLAPKLDALTPTLDCAADYLQHADVLKALSEGMYFRLHQISDYSWLDEEEVARACDRMNRLIGPDCDRSTRFEKELILYSQVAANRKLIDRLTATFARHGEDANFEPCAFEARVDVVSTSAVWEIKCVSQLTVDHMIQLCVYAWIWSALERPPKAFRLFNVKTNTQITLDASDEQLDDILFHLVSGRDKDSSAIADDQFLAMAIEACCPCIPAVV